MITNIIAVVHVYAWKGCPWRGEKLGRILPAKLEKDFNNIGLDITRDAIERTHRIGPVIIDVDDFDEETTRQQVIVKFKSWSDHTKVYRARKKSKSYRYRVDLTRRRLKISCIRPERWQIELQLYNSLSVMLTVDWRLD